MLDREQVRKVALLARLQITPEEEAKLALDLGNILDYIRQLNELDTQAVPPTNRALETVNVSRPDQLSICDQREAILQAGPAVEGDFFRVPKIL